MIQPVSVNVITAEDGTKAFVIGLDLIVPLNAEGLPELAAELLGTAEPITEQDQEDAHEQ